MKMVSEMKMVIKLKLKVEKIATKVREETLFGLTGQDIGKMLCKTRIYS